jgi:cytochrome c peroxidase
LPCHPSGNFSSLLGCEPADFTRIGALTANELPISSTNAYADDPGAATLGQALFFEEGMSADGQLACASCHDPDHAFADPRPFSLGAFDRVGGRHAPSLINVAFNRFQLWDGRADSLWAQPIKAIEAQPEGDFTRTELAHFIRAEYAGPYEAVFGPLPTLSDLPARAKPGDAAWHAMPASQQDAVNRIAANVGKAIEAYERKLICTDTAFDRFMLDGEALSDRATEGGEHFLSNRGAGCARCHSGPNLTDDRFHNLGLDHAGTPDEGRAAGVPQLLADPFNGAGRYSDDPTAGAANLANVLLNRGDLGAFKTPGLRGVAQRDRFGHLGHRDTLEGWIGDVYRRGGGGGGRGARRGGGDNNGDNFAGELSPLFPRGFDRDEVDDMAAFLRTFDCPPLPEALKHPPTDLPGR